MHWTERWSREDLSRRLCAALDTCRQAVELLACDGYVDSEEPTNNVRPEKVISESALLALAASFVRDQGEVTHKLREVVEALTPHARSERMLLEICTDPTLAWDYALAHTCLTRMGRPDPRFDSVLHLIARAEAGRGKERLPHRALERIWVEDAVPSTRPQPMGTRRAWSVALRNSLLFHPVDLLGASRDDLYAFTHALIYGCGFQSGPHCASAARRVVLGNAEGGLARCLDEEDYDLAGELLLAWPMTGAEWSSVGAFGFRVLARIEDEAGFLLSNGTRLERLQALTGQGRTRYLVATAYHTAYVMGLLCASCLSGRHGPPTAVSGGTAPGSRAVRTLLEFLDQDDVHPHWRAEMESLDRIWCGALGGFLLTVGLRRSALKRNFGRMHELMLVAVGLKLTRLPAARQALQLLERLATAWDAKPASAGSILRSSAVPVLVA